MPRLVFLPLIMFTLVALLCVTVTLLVERAERRRRLRHPAVMRRIFSPKIIAGGKLPALPQTAEEDAKADGTRVSKTA